MAQAHYHYIPIIRESLLAPSTLMRPTDGGAGITVLSVQRVTEVCQHVGADFHAGEGLRYRIINAATALFLAIGSLERAMARLQVSSHISDQVRADLDRARSLLVRLEAIAHTAPEDDLRRDVLEARELVLAASSTLMGVLR